jgi:hypothetical protein
MVLVVLAVSQMRLSMKSLDIEESGLPQLHILKDVHISAALAVNTGRKQTTNDNCRWIRL